MLRQKRHTLLVDGVPMPVRGGALELKLAEMILRGRRKNVYLPANESGVQCMRSLGHKPIYYLIGQYEPPVIDGWKMSQRDICLHEAGHAVAAAAIGAQVTSLGMYSDVDEDGARSGGSVQYKNDIDVMGDGYEAAMMTGLWRAGVVAVAGEVLYPMSYGFGDYAYAIKMIDELRSCGVGWTHDEKGALSVLLNAAWFILRENMHAVEGLATLMMETDGVKHDLESDECDPGVRDVLSQVKACPRHLSVCPS